MRIKKIGNLFGATGGSFAGNIYDPSGLAPTLNMAEGGYREPMILEIYEGKTDMAKKYRIRKLTPRECFRLMGVRDEDIAKIQSAGISKSQQYKMAGNSIVVDVLMGIFQQMFDPKYVEESSQLSLW